MYLLNTAEGKEDHKGKDKEGYQSVPPIKVKKMIKELPFLIKGGVYSKNKEALLYYRKEDNFR